MANREVLYPCACKTPDDLDGCMEMVDMPGTICEFCEDCRHPERVGYPNDHR